MTKKAKRAWLLSVCALTMLSVGVAAGCGGSGSSNTNSSIESVANQYTINVDGTDFKASVGDMAPIPSATLVDKDGNVVEQEITINVADPEGEMVGYSDGEFRCSVSGDYTITYSAVGAESVVIKVTSGDLTAPVVTIKAVVGKAVVGSNSALPGIMYEDDSEINYKKTTLDLFYDNNGTLEPYEYSILTNSFVPDKAGTYVLKSHAEDIYGNAADDEWTVNVVDPNWTDTQLEEGVYADFDSAGYLNMFESGTIAMWVNHNEYKYLETFEGETGVVHIKVNYNKMYSPGWWCVNIAFPEAVNVDEIDALGLKMYIGDPETIDSTIYVFDFCTQNDAAGSTAVSAFSASKKGWVQVQIPKTALDILDVRDGVDDGLISGIQLGGGGKSSAYTTDLYIESIYETEVIKTPYSISTGVFEHNGLYEDYITVEKVEEEATVEEGVTIDGYTKITTTADVQAVGVEFKTDAELAVNAEKVVFYVNFAGDMSTMSIFLSETMDLNLCHQHVDLTQIDGCVEGVYGDWVKVSFSKSYATEDVKLLAFSYFLDGMPVGTEICISELTYVEKQAPSEDTVEILGSKYYMVSTGEFSPSSNYGEDITVEKVEEETTVAEGVTINDYTKVTVLKELQSIGVNTNWGYDVEAFAKAEKVAFYIKGSVEVMTIFLAADMGTMFRHVDLVEGEQYGYVTGVYNGWVRVEFTIGRAEDAKCLAFWDGIEVGSEICISGIEYIESQAPVVEPEEILNSKNYSVSTDLFSANNSYADYITVEKVETETAVGEDATINAYSKVTVMQDMTALNIVPNWGWNSEAFAKAEKVAFYVKGCSVITICLDEAMTLQWRNVDLEEGEEFGYVTSVYNGWVKVEFNKTMADEDANMLVFWGGIEVGTEICISEVEYIEPQAPAVEPEEILGSKDYMIFETLDFIPDDDYADFLTVEKVETETTIGNDKINGYTKVTVTAGVQGVGITTNWGYNTEEFATAEKVAFYIKGSATVMSIFLGEDMATIYRNVDLVEGEEFGYVTGVQDGWVRVEFTMGRADDAKSIAFWAGSGLAAGAELLISDIIYIQPAPAPTTADWNATVILVDVNGQETDVTSMVEGVAVSGTVEIGTQIDLTEIAQGMLTTNPALANYELDTANSILSGEVTAEGLALKVVYKEKVVVIPEEILNTKNYSISTELFVANSDHADYIATEKVETATTIGDVTINGYTKVTLKQNIAAINVAPNWGWNSEEFATAEKVVFYVKGCSVFTICLDEGMTLQWRNVDLVEGEEFGYVTSVQDGWVRVEFKKGMADEDANMLVFWGGIEAGSEVCFSEVMYIQPAPAPTTADWNATVILVDVNGQETDVTAMVEGVAVSGTVEIGTQIDLTEIAQGMLTTNPALANYELDTANSILSGEVTAEGLALKVVYKEKVVVIPEDILNSDDYMIFETLDFIPDGNHANYIATERVETETVIGNDKINGYTKVSVTTGIQGIGITTNWGYNAEEFATAEKVAFYIKGSATVMTIFLGADMATLFRNVDLVEGEEFGYVTGVQDGWVRVEFTLGRAEDAKSIAFWAGSGLAAGTELLISDIIYVQPAPAPTTADWNATVILVDVNGQETDVTAMVEGVAVSGTVEIGTQIDLTEIAQGMLTTNPALANYELDTANSILSGEVTAEGLALKVVYKEKVVVIPEEILNTKNYSISTELFVANGDHANYIATEKVETATTIGDVTINGYTKVTLKQNIAAINVAPNWGWNAEEFATAEKVVFYVKGCSVFTICLDEGMTLVWRNVDLVEGEEFGYVTSVQDGWVRVEFKKGMADEDANMLVFWGGIEAGSEVCFSEVMYIQPAPVVPAEPEEVLGSTDYMIFETMDFIPDSDYEDYIAVEKVEAETTIGNDKINGYTKVTVKAGVQGVGLTTNWGYNAEAFATAEKVAFYIKGSATVMTIFLGADMATLYRHVDLVEGEEYGYVTGVYDGWVRVEFTLGRADDAKSIAFWAGSGLAADTELLISDIIYVQPAPVPAGPAKILGSEDYMVFDSTAFVPDSDYEDYITVEKVEAETTIGNDKISGYTKVTVKAGVQGVGLTTNWGYNAEAFATAEKVVFYIKGSATVMSIFLGQDLATPFRNVDLEEGEEYKYVTSVQDGWVRVEFTIERANDAKSIAFWAGSGLAANTELLISDIIYV